jgi:hypothetical protein
MAHNPRDYPETMASAETGRLMTRGEKLVTFKVQGRRYSYKQPGWWCSLTDPDDTEGSSSMRTTRWRKWRGEQPRPWPTVSACLCRS